MSNNKIGQLHLRSHQDLLEHSQICLQESHISHLVPDEGDSEIPRRSLLARLANIFKLG